MTPLPYKGLTALDNCGQHGSSFSESGLLPLKAAILCVISQGCPLSHSWSLNVTNFDTDQKPIREFLLMNITNLCPISQHFRVIADYLQSCTVHPIYTGSLQKAVCHVCVLSQSLMVNSHALQFGWHISVDSFSLLTLLECVTCSR